MAAESTKNLNRSKSMSSLTQVSDSDFKGRSLSESSVEVCVIYDSESDCSEVRGRNEDSGIGADVFGMFEQKIDTLNDLFLEQCKLLTEMKNEIRSSRAAIEKTDLTQNKFVAELLRNALMQSDVKELESSESATGGFNSRARSLLAAIETKHAFSLDREIRDALVDFLQSDELKQHMVSATVESVRDMVNGHFSRDVATLYLPMLERSQQRMAKHLARVLESAFIELEENSASLSNAVYKTSRSLRRALERHQTLLEDSAGFRSQDFGTLQQSLEELVGKELKQWRQQAVDALCDTPTEDYCEGETPETPSSLAYSPSCVPQPGNDISAIDQLMEAALITKQLSDGDINDSFERALSAESLALVMVACRAADPGAVFTPCHLKQPVMLSLCQQLATDLVHETQLKCKYLEEALMNLKPSDPGTREHLPLVVGEVRKHLTKFLATYPAHMASRQIRMIVMAADNLLKS